MKWGCSNAQWCSTLGDSLVDGMARQFASILIIYCTWKDVSLNSDVGRKRNGLSGKRLIYNDDHTITIFSRVSAMPSLVMWSLSLRFSR